jgi:hypothetical protein
VKKKKSIVLQVDAVIYFFEKTLMLDCLLSHFLSHWRNSYLVGTVLEGTMMNLLQSICTSSSIPFIHTSLALSAAHKWTGIALTSTSRGLLPIGELRIPRALFEKYFRDGKNGAEKEREKEGEKSGKGNEEVVIIPPQSSLLQSLRKQMDESLLSSSKTIIK